MRYKYIFNIQRFKKNAGLLKLFDQKASDLDKLITAVDLSSLGISEYNVRYISDIKRNIVGYLQVYNYLIESAISGGKKEIKEAVFIDYGGGSGILSLLAKQIGFGTVIYNDIFPDSCEDAAKLAGALNISVDHFVRGDIDDLLDYLRKHDINADFIVGSDVIEHIYDVDDFLIKISGLSKDHLTMVMGTGANPFNPRIRRKHIQLHYDAEYSSRPSKFGDKPSDTLESFFGIRKKYIREKLAEITEEELDRLAKQTRGLILDDIEKYLEEYRSEGTMSYSPNHPSNTCDPYNGNWSEQLHDVDRLISVLEKNGFDAEVTSSFYMHSSQKLVQTMKDGINFLISISGRLGLSFSPYYILTARK